MGWTRSVRISPLDAEVVSWTNNEVRLSRIGGRTNIYVQGLWLNDINSRPHAIIQFLVDELFDRLEVSRLESIPIKHHGVEIKDE